MQCRRCYAIYWWWRNIKSREIHGFVYSFNKSRTNSSQSCGARNTCALSHLSVTSRMTVNLISARIKQEKGKKDTLQLCANHPSCWPLRCPKPAPLSRKRYSVPSHRVIFSLRESDVETLRFQWYYIRHKNSRSEYHLDVCPNITAKQYHSPQANITEKVLAISRKDFFFGCSCQARTDDIMINSHALYRLS